MKANESFNPSLKRPILDLILALVLIVAGGFVWFHQNGAVALAGAAEQLNQTYLENQTELKKSQAALERSRQELEEIRAERDSKAAYLEFLKDRIDQEQRALHEDWERQRPFVESAAGLSTEIDRYQDLTRAYRTDIIETQWKIETKRLEVAELEQRMRGTEPDFLAQESR